tara:strand:+ start:50 stop:1582 length:1533 start_codon:yes stop_codon:yes gene_type:complete
MAKQVPHPDEQQLIAKLLAFRDDPLSFVLYAFPWGQPNTPLANHVGPRQWQLDALNQMREHLLANNRKLELDQIPELLKLARASGRGIGKSAFLAWIALWLFSCLPSSTVIVSANTEQQLKSTTFPEIRKWATMSINKRWFEHNVMSLYPAEWLVTALKETTGYDDAYWYIQAKLWSEENPNAFAGPHSQMGMAVLFDEASGIPGDIWPVAQGYFTDKTTHRIWIAISNPRNPSGEFFECFHGNRDQWNHATIDGRDVNENDHGVYDSIIRQYGPDSDQARVEVYGQFPRQGDDNFIARGEVEDAVERELIPDNGAPLLMGVDPARMGRDKAVIRFRQGRDARSIQPQVFAKCTTEQMAEHCSTAIEKYKPDHVFIEADGIGGPVCELLSNAGYRIIEVQAGGAAQDKTVFYLHRTELWGRMRDWIPTGCLPSEGELVDDLCAMRYSVNLKGQLALWPKEKMRKEGFASPDYADALAMTFSKNVSRNDAPSSRRFRKNRVVVSSDYDIFT